MGFRAIPPLQSNFLPALPSAHPGCGSVGPILHGSATCATGSQGVRVPSSCALHRRCLRAIAVMGRPGSMSLWPAL